MVTIEIPRKSVETEQGSLSLLKMSITDAVGPFSGIDLAYIDGAQDALRWINSGHPPPSEIIRGVTVQGDEA